MRYAASAGMVMLTASTVAATLLVHLARSLPNTDGLWTQQTAPRITLLDIHGAPIPIHGRNAGAPVRLSELPAHAALAVLAVEDRNFYHHWGFNPVSLARAAIANAEAGEVRQGGSTITQQLAKNLFLAPDRTMRRKVQELLLALWLELEFTKDEILTLYLNRAYFGSGAYGLDAASRRYFGKPARDLEIGESAVLAGLLKAPTRLSPTRNPESAGARARIVLDAMERAKFLNAAEAAAARREPVRIAPARYAAAPYFVDYALQETRALTQGLDADLIVATSFDPALQTALEAGLAAGLRASPLGAEVQSAIVLLDAEGGVRAMSGGRDYATSQFNRATQALRQPGSAFKPFVFLAALNAGYEPSSTVVDAPIVLDRWRPGNYGGRYYGEVSMTEALALSLNSAAIRVQERIGRGAVRRTARAMGLEGVKTKGPSLALGVDAVSPLDLAGAYAPLANGGFSARPHVINSIRTVDGALVWRRDPAFGETVASFRNIQRLNAMLEAVAAWGTGRSAQIEGVRVAGKTGTTQDGRDAWFAGHAQGLVCVVWVGRDDNAPVPGMTGGAAPAVIWRETMRRALAARSAAKSPLAAQISERT
jgi:penicillin-binding protein 1A